MKKIKTLIIIFILFIMVFSVFNTTSFLAFASNDINLDDYYAFVEKKRTLSKSGEIENVLIFRVDANAYSKNKRDDMPPLDEFLAKASTAIRTIRESFPDSHLSTEIITPKSKVVIVLSSYASSEEYDIRNGRTNLDKPNSTYEKEKGVVYNKTISKIPYFFANIENEKIKECIDTFKNIDTNQDKFLYTETYVYPYGFDRFSTNADESYKDSSTNLYVHKYYANGNQLNSRDLIFTQSSPNPAFWYGISISGGVLVLFLLVLTLLVYQKKVSKENIQS